MRTRNYLIAAVVTFVSAAALFGSFAAAAAPTGNTESAAIKQARLAQNAAIVSNDVDAIAS